MPKYCLRTPRCRIASDRTGSSAIGFISRMMLACACLCLLTAPGAAAASGPMTVAATILPLADFCQKIGGDLVKVQVLIPPGASPHAFEPAPSVMARASQARVFVFIGAGLEPWATKLLSSRGSKDLVVVEAAQDIPLLGMTESHHGHDEAEAQEHAGHAPGQKGAHAAHPGGNPHIWLDPVLTQGICKKIVTAFIDADPAHREQYEANYKDYVAQLAALDQEIKQHARQWRLRDYVSFHPAFSYFAQRYGLNDVGTIETSPGREPTPRHLQDLVTAIRHYGIKVVFAEPQLNPRVAEVIAQEAGVKVLMLDPMGGRPPYGDDYLQLMRYNLAMLDQALK
jgi:zinc transport system substrate-binding protein